MTAPTISLQEAVEAELADARADLLAARIAFRHSPNAQRSAAFDAAQLALDSLLDTYLAINPRLIGADR